MGTQKHRTQISLETWQYEALMEVSRKTRRSLAAILRDMIAEKFAGDKINPAEDPIMGIIGIGSGDGKAAARNHDKFLYNHNRRELK
ncbi:MAG: ribbon-helix-helix domain-containing protein [Thermodesulfobacteriota bacterium]